MGPDPVIITLQFDYTICLNLFDNQPAHALYPTSDFDLFIGH